VDFVSTHTYGSPPLDLRPLAGDRPLLWTEWGVTATHGSEVNDTVFAGAFLLRGMRSASRRVEALAPWVASDHFEELGRPPALFHGGFGLRTVGELRKPRWWALAMLERLGEQRLEVTAGGDGGGSLVEVVAAKAADGVHTGALWYATLDQTKMHGSAPLARDVAVEVTGLEPGAAYELTHERLDQDHSNIARLWAELREDGQDWPTEEQWTTLRDADRLERLEPAQTLTADAGGTVRVDTLLPMPSMSLLTLSPAS
jgi:xylan 1,4-beta-xylosidase